MKPNNFSSKSKKEAPKKTLNSDELRLNKYISNSGVCSRRDADLYIQSGNVKVNGIVITEMGYKVKTTDAVEFDGRKLNPEKKVYILLNKPKGFTTAEDQKTKPVSDLVRTASNYQLFPVGRMDATTTGLLLFTNDKDLITKFSSPQQKSTKIYQVSLDKNLKN